MNRISYLKRKEINTAMWDDCIRQSSHPLIYACSWYLDITARGQWDALILGDYEAVMPLPWKSKLGIRYIYTPFFTNPLGIFSRSRKSITVDEFLSAIPSQFKLRDMNLMVPDLLLPPGIPFSSRKNHILSLNRPTDELRKNYRTSYRQILQKSKDIHVLKKDIPLKDILTTAEQEEKSGRLKRDDFSIFARLCSAAEVNAAIRTYGVYGQENQILASGVFFIYLSRIYYVLAGNTAAGRKSGASHVVIDAVISEFAGRDMILDFEGSDIPGIAFFFEGFGAKPETYYFIRQNFLPFWLKWYP